MGPHLFEWYFMAFKFTIQNVNEHSNSTAVNERNSGNAMNLDMWIFDMVMTLECVENAMNLKEDERKSSQLLLRRAVRRQLERGAAARRYLCLSWLHSHG